MAVGIISVLPTSAEPAGYYDSSNRKRAEHFAYVCMESAPSFNTAEARLEKRRSGEHAQGALYPMESQMELRENETSCSCAVAFAGMNADDMLDMVKTTLMDKYSEDIASDTQISGNKIAFQFDGESVDVTLTSLKRRQIFWVIARATRDGDCPS